MNKQKEVVLKRLDNLRSELKNKNLNSEMISVITDAINYIQNIPVTYDKNTICQAIACMSCQKCMDDFDMVCLRCKKRYEEAEMFYETQIIDEE